MELNQVELRLIIIVELLVEIVFYNEVDVVILEIVVVLIIIAEILIKEVFVEVNVAVIGRLAQTVTKAMMKIYRH